ncbi:MAG: sugar transferase [Clostridia bacterium]|nr:sugar transferase [Clostridium sp.]MBS6252932.1 sugar transferase [Clostridium sp.]
MDVKENILSCKKGNIENLKITPILERNKTVLKFEKIIKRFMDILGGGIGVLTLIPLTLIIWIANKLVKDEGPIFYTQERIGKNGKIFKMYKYRSMVIGADEKLTKYLEENEDAREEYKKYKKLKNDPRITVIGKILRKTSLDEFPQFINVLKGDMSLVGPRPYLPREKEDMNGFFKYITSCKPGLTGFWQVNGRNDVTFTDRLSMDMNYYYNHNLKLDIKLLIKTLVKVFKKEGAI